MQMLGHIFTDTALAETCLTHRSYAKEQGLLQDYERLEFLGDAVLELLCSNYLYKMHPDADEGWLTRRRAAMVNQEALAWWATEIKLGSHIRLGKGEQARGGMGRPALLADCIEALIGAIYLDADLHAAQQCCAPWMARLDQRAAQRGVDHKTLLQEIIQKQGRATPIYTMKNKTGPAHAPQFTVGVFLENELLAEGQGSSQKAAGQDAARSALERLRNSEKH